MRSNILGILGIWIVLVVFILSPGTSQRVLLIASGIAIALLALWPARTLQAGGPVSSRNNHVADHV